MVYSFHISKACYFFLVDKNKNHATQIKMDEKHFDYQEASESSLNSDSGPFLPHNPEILRVSSNHCSDCSSVGISHSW